MAQRVSSETLLLEVALSIEKRSAREVFGSPDDLKLKSSATLFAAVLLLGSLFHQLLTRYFQGKPDDNTLRFLAFHEPGG
jgi:uncharacterized protein (DUF1810 family)